MRQLFYKGCYALVLPVWLSAGGGPVYGQLSVAFVPQRAPSGLYAMPQPDFSFLTNDNVTDDAVDREISGRVLDENGEGLPGVSILVKGTQRGTSTDLQGRFNLSIPSQGEVILVLSFVGYETAEVPVGNSTNLEISMKVDAKSLDEVVVVAFGEQKKESVVSAISTIRPTELRVPSSNLTT